MELFIILISIIVLPSKHLNNLFSFQYLFLKRLYMSDKDEGYDEEMAKCLPTYNGGALTDHSKEPAAEKVTQPMGSLPFVLLHLGSVGA